jgi:hypothetical protein
MALHRIDAILWRSYMTSTSDALWGVRSNQYYIDLPASDYETFFDGRAEQSVDQENNSTFTIRLEPFDGEPAVAQYQIEFEKKREGIARAGSWNINGQHSDTAYPLWKSGRGPSKRFQEMEPDEKKRNFIVIARDLEGKFHGRWVRAEDFDELPNCIKTLLEQKSAGWSLL